jgi:hypothetical protein
MGNIIVGIFRMTLEVKAPSVDGFSMIRVSGNWI